MAATASAAVTTPAGLEQLSRQQCVYTACYCEENVYHLLQHLIHSKGRQAVNLFAVFISNSSETVSEFQWGSIASASLTERELRYLQCQHCVLVLGSSLTR